MSKKTIEAFSFMAVATGSESKEPQIKRYRGVGAVGVLAVNPTRAELNSIYGSSNITEEIKYVGEGTAKDKNGNEIKVPQVRLTFILKTDPSIACNNGIETIIPVSIFLNKAYTFSPKQGVTKVQVIDEYGRTGWVTEEELKNHIVPEYEIKRGEHAGQTAKAQLTENYRPCYAGEEDLCKLIIALLNIPRPDYWDEESKTYIMKSDPNELKKSLCRLDELKSYFEGNVKELQKIVKFQPNNRFKLCFGIRTAKNGNQYQCAYTTMPMKLGVTSFNTLKSALEADKAAGRHPSEEYVASSLEEVNMSATDYTKPEEKEKAEEDPFAKSTGAIAGSPETTTGPEDDLPPADDEDPFKA